MNDYLWDWWFSEIPLDEDYDCCCDELGSECPACEVDE